MKKIFIAIILSLVAFGCSKKEKETNKETIVYNAEANKVYVTNPKKDSSLMVYNIEGKCLRGVKGSELYLTGLPAGLYIVSYNNTLNVKILKK